MRCFGKRVLLFAAAAVICLTARDGAPAAPEAGPDPAASPEVAITFKWKLRSDYAPQVRSAEIWLIRGLDGKPRMDRLVGDQPFAKDETGWPTLTAPEFTMPRDGRGTLLKLITHPVEPQRPHVTFYVLEGAAPGAVLTDKEGRFAIDYHHYYKALVVEAPGFAPACAPMSEGEKKVEVVLEPGRDVTLQFLDVAGKPRQALPVSLTWPIHDLVHVPMPFAEDVPVVMGGVTDAQGQILVKSLLTRVYLLNGKQTVIQLKRGETTLVFREPPPPPPPTPRDYILTDCRTGKPIVGATAATWLSPDLVWPQSVKDAPPKTTACPSDDQGRLTMASAAYEVAFKAPGYMPLVIYPEMVKETTTTLEMQPAGEFRMTVRDAAGRPVMYRAALQFGVQMSGAARAAREAPRPQSYRVIDHRSHIGIEAQPGETVSAQVPLGVSFRIRLMRIKHTLTEAELPTYCLPQLGRVDAPTGAPVMELNLPALAPLDVRFESPVWNGKVAAAISIDFYDHMFFISESYHWSIGGTDPTTRTKRVWLWPGVASELSVCLKPTWWPGPRSAVFITGMGTAGPRVTLEPYKPGGPIQRLSVSIPEAALRKAELAP